MSFPIPPTDNLYKFLAITGLLIILGTQFLMWSAVRELHEKRFEIEPLKDAIDQETERLKGEVAEIKSETTKGKVTESLQERTLKAKERNEALEVRLAEVNAKIALLGVLTDRFTLISRLAVGGFVLGSGLSVAGFYLWYTRVQVHQDKALKRAK